MWLYEVPIRVSEKEGEYNKRKVEAVVSFKIDWFKLVGDNGNAEEYPMHDRALQWRDTFTFWDASSELESP